MSIYTKVNSVNQMPPIFEMRAIYIADFLPAILFAPVIYNIVPLLEKLWSMIAF